MKIFLSVIGILALVFFETGDIFAGSVDYLSNQSAANIRNYASNAKTDEADAVNYNPAGTAFMEDGMYIQANNQTIFKEYKQEIRD